MAAKCVPDKDIWLSSILQKDVFNLDFEGDHELENVTNTSIRPCVLCAKVSTENSRQLNYLQENGFFVVDCNVQFELSDSAKLPSCTHDVSHASRSDKDALYKLAFSGFEQNRFHRDPNIENRIASDIKALWVSNFFSGERGDYLLVSRDKGEITGFLLVISKNNEMVIDLIMVKSNYRGSGVASSLIAFAFNNLFHSNSRCYVGTQLGNLSSIMLYQKLGFQLRQASYILHKHLE